MSEIISKNKHVTLSYSVYDDSGEMVERIDLPIQYIHGKKSQVIEKIEITLEGHKEGDTVDVVLSPEDGFGPHLPELTFTDNLENVPEEFRSIGAEVEFQNDQGEGKIFRVTKIENGKLTVDGNHPFAGKNITYHITISGVRDATAEELANGVQNMPALH